jgi:sporulation protein YlmC with PRC-barrel domain
MKHACISSSKVAGTAVYNANGDKLGSIDDVIIDKLSGQVRYAALEFGGFLGVGTDRYPIPWSMLKYDTRLDGYVVPLRKEQLGKGSALRADQHARVHGRLRPQGPRLLWCSLGIADLKPRKPIRRRLARFSRRR